MRKKIDIDKIKLTKEEQKIEDSIEKYVDVSPEENIRIERMLASYRKNAVLHMRINQVDLQNLKRKAKKIGVKYQTFIAEILHRIAQS